MSTRKTIAIDMDGVLANNMAHYLDYHFKETGIRILEKEIQGKPEERCFEDPDAVYRYLKMPDFFRTLPINPDAQEVVKKLNDHFNVFIVSAAMEFPWSLVEKYEWLGEHFPFITWHQIVFCGNKGIIKADYMIDDHIYNLRSFSGTGLIFDCYHNINETGFERLVGWKAVEEYFFGKEG
ncbi:5'(3')-deoxyribonucleotidase [Sphingobacterium sp. 1.A.5]|uniref:5' nucleotidase, NT5C type n=1 Tax=Sphingobacterium sp. 1.A.5 TaxID=2044604 RepID=UPI000C0C0D80|nr:5'(3')-deoxyribonucleotidase [Sphingobacterium sp. 1.A.5]